MPVFTLSEPNAGLVNAAPNPAVVDSSSASRRVRTTESFDFDMRSISSRVLQAVGGFTVDALLPPASAQRNPATPATRTVHEPGTSQSQPALLYPAVLHQC